MALLEEVLCSPHSGFLDTSNVKKNYVADPNSKFYNKKFYNPEYMDLDVEGPELIRLYSGKNDPYELDYADVWDAAYQNVIRLANLVVESGVLLSSVLLWRSVLLLDRVDHLLSLRKRPIESQVQRRARAQEVPDGRREVYCLQIVRCCVPRSSHYD